LSVGWGHEHGRAEPLDYLHIPGISVAASGIVAVVATRL
jgi:hypothetical protein